MAAHRPQAIRRTSSPRREPAPANARPRTAARPLAVTSAIASRLDLSPDRIARGCSCAWRSSPSATQCTSRCPWRDVSPALTALLGNGRSKVGPCPPRSSTQPRSRCGAPCSATCSVSRRAALTLAADLATEGVRRHRDARPVGPELTPLGGLAFSRAARAPRSPEGEPRRKLEAVSHGPNSIRLSRRSGRTWGCRSPRRSGRCHCAAHDLGCAQSSGCG